MLPSEMPLTIPKLRFSEPRRNLPSWTGRATQEDRFVIAFARAYIQQEKALSCDASEGHMALAREIPVNGYGIADLVAVSSLGRITASSKVGSVKRAWASRPLANDAGKMPALPSLTACGDAPNGPQPPHTSFPRDQEGMDERRIIIRAFECKMRDWRSALRQAARYRFFAHQAIVVLPVPAMVCALPFLETFRKVHVGLWTFDQETETIHQQFTPRPEKVKAPHYIPRVIQAVYKATKSIPPISRTG